MLNAGSSAALGTRARCGPLSKALQRRLASMTTSLSVDPALSFPKTFTSAELEGAYRFFGNSRVTPDGILAAHYDETSRASAAEPSVLVVHDSSTFAFDPEGAREGLGRVRKAGQAFFAHASLVLSDDGRRRPLGLAAMHTWIRDEPHPGTERARWLAAVERCTYLGDAAHLVHVMDREADDYALFTGLIAGGHRFVVRLAHDRMLLQTAPGDPRKTSDALARVECAVQREARVSKRIDGGRSPKQKKIHRARGARTATLSIATSVVTLRRPDPQPKTLPASLSLHVVRVWEATPPEGEEPIEWLLVTSDRIESVAEALRIVDRYRARWTIEEYFKAIKTGCAFLKRQLGDYESLVNALAVFAPIACRMLALRTLAHDDPDAPATTILSTDELEVLRTLGRRPLPPAPTTRDVLLAVAALGGHIKWAGDPGWQTIAHGFEKLETLTRGYRLGKIRRESDQR
jgi:hypothetical protein